MFLLLTLRTPPCSPLPTDPYDGAGAGADVGPGSDDPLELEHVVGYAGQWRHSLYCHPSKDTMFVTCLGANVAVGDVTDPHQQEFLRAHDAEVSALALSASGALIASGQVGSGSSPSHEAPVVVWDFATRKQLFNQFGIRGQVTLLSFSPDEQFLAAAGSDKMLFVWDMDTGDQIYGKAQVGSTCTKHTHTHTHTHTRVSFFPCLCLWIACLLLVFFCV